MFSNLTDSVQVASIFYKFKILDNLLRKCLGTFSLGSIVFISRDGNKNISPLCTKLKIEKQFSIFNFVRYERLGHLAKYFCSPRSKKY